jgi:alpha-D-xyloside xylohydrolase
MTYNEANRTLTLGDRNGTYPGMLTERTFQIVIVDKDKPTGLAFSNKPDISIRYDGRKVNLSIH